MNWSIIVNPAAKSGKAKKLWHQKVVPLLQKKAIPFDVFFTESEGHAIEITQKLIEEGSRNIAAVGGDGTFHEIVNGIMSQRVVHSTDIVFAVIPMGTGNDWIRSLEIPNDIEAAIEVLQNGTPFLQDMGLVSYQKQGQTQQRYFMNVAGAGFDAFVAQQMGKAPKRFGALTYFWELLKGLVAFENIPINLQSKDFQANTPIFMLNVGVGKFLGSGMKVVPDALLDDGLFDITFIENPTKLEVAGQLKNLYDGSFINFHKVTSFRTSKISIEASGKIPLYLQADGEILGHAPLQFEILPKRLKVLR